MYKYHLEDVEWGEFFVEELFFSSRGNAINLSSRNMDEKLENSYAVISAKDSNNGISGFSKAMKNEKIYNGVITINNNGSVGYSYFHKYDFIASSDVTILTPRNNNINLSKSTLIFITECLQRIAKDKFAYGYKASNNRLNRTKIMLPVDEIGCPNWHFMEEYIKERESKQRNDLKEYYKSRLLDLVICPEVLTDVEWGEFFVSDVFDTVQRGKRLTKANQIDGEIPYISSTALNNGVDNFIGNTEKVRKSDNDLTLANSGSVGACFYHNYEYIASDHVTSLKLPNGSDTVYKFISVILGRLEEKYSFNREINDTRIKREKILLPIDKDGNPNWFYMENFIKNIEQKQIKNVLQYLDKYIYIYIMYNHFDKANWKEFFLSDICNINSGVRLTKANMQDGNIPFIGATDSNNGITNFVSNTNDSHDKNVLGVNYNGSVVENFYHPYSCVFSDDVKRVSFKDEQGQNKYCYMFLKQMILQQKEKYRYAYKFNGDRMARQKVMMPVDELGDIDFKFMNRYIASKEMKKLVEILKDI